MAGRYVRLPGVKGGEPEARSEQIMCEVASAAQRGNCLKEAKLLGCRRPRRSPSRTQQADKQGPEHGAGMVSEN